jgi:hypothetical protein
MSVQATSRSKGLEKFHGLRITVALAAIIPLSLMVLAACSQPVTPDPGISPTSDGALVGQSEINLKFTLPSETWVDGVQSARLMLYANAETFYNSAPAYTFNLIVTKSAAVTTVEGICRSIDAATYLMEVKLLDSSGASLRRHLDFVTVTKLVVTPVTLNFKRTVGQVSLVCGGSHRPVTTRLSLCDPVTKEILNTIGSVYTHYNQWNGIHFSLFTNVTPGSYTIYFELFDVNGMKIAEGYKDNITVQALADTKTDVTVSANFGSLRVGSASFTD